MMTLDPVILTGATGFIGKHLLARLQPEGHPLVSLQRRIDTALDDGVERIGWSLDDPELGMVTEHDCCRDGTLVHLAGVAHRRGHGYSARHEFESLNAAATLRLAESAADCGVRHFIFMSSIGVLGGDSGDSAFDENSRPAPVSQYARSKLLAEQGLEELAARSDLNVTVLRPPLVYGADAPGNFGSLVGAIRNGIPLPFGSIRNARQMLAVDNLVDAIAAAAADGGAKYRVFNLADRECVSTAELCTRIADILQRPPRIFPFPPAMLGAALRALGRESLAQGMLGNMRISTTTIETALHWQPQVTLQRGLERALLNDDDH